MCNTFLHSFLCLHVLRETAPCATSKTAPCGVEKVKQVKHNDKCDRCHHSEQVLSPLRPSILTFNAWLFWYRIPILFSLHRHSSGYASDAELSSTYGAWCSKKRRTHWNSQGVWANIRSRPRLGGRTLKLRTVYLVIISQRLIIRIMGRDSFLVWLSDFCPLWNEASYPLNCLPHRCTDSTTWNVHFVPLI